MDSTRLKALKANMFPCAHDAIENWEVFSWHTHAHSSRSSQMLAIDVFGTLMVSEQNVIDEVVAEIARHANLPCEGPWSIALEWQDPHNALNEPRQTQVDAIAISPNVKILFECKFTEAGGSCSQTKRGKDTLKACNGNYRIQSNPRTGISARCVLSAKGIRYWNWTETLYGLRPQEDHHPCPFASDSYQWMRNSALAAALEDREQIRTRVFAVYADADFLQTSLKVKTGQLGLKTISEEQAIIPLS